ncbi:pyridoxal phosphate-dependent aminotransferase family protein [Flavobacteriaceae bacterium MHTCC 0001]
MTNIVEYYLYMLPKKLQKKLDERSIDNALRHLKNQSDLIDFSSNDYLGFSKSEAIFDTAHSILKTLKVNGATGSRLLSGNHSLYQEVEKNISEFHQCETALIFNSGYNANIGFFSSVPQRSDVILYDEYIHASIRDGITMSNAKSYKFKHNDLKDLSKMLKRSSSTLEFAQHNNIYIVTESVFSMDGDTPNLLKLVEVSKKHNALLVIDEAHAIGVFGEKGMGLTQYLNIQNEIFARIITFGKAIGCHGAAILGSHQLKEYLVNFCRSFIYTTALPPHSIATIKAAYIELESTENRIALLSNIDFFKKEIQKHHLKSVFVDSDSAIQCCIIPGNNNVKSISHHLQQQGFDVKPILSPTVPKNEERLRFCLHSYNTREDIRNVLNILNFVINI